jgi:hypothetical protein
VSVGLDVNGESACSESAHNRELCINHFWNGLTARAVDLASECVCLLQQILSLPHAPSVSNPKRWEEGTLSGIPNSLQHHADPRNASCGCGTISDPPRPADLVLHTKRSND